MAATGPTNIYSHHPTGQDAPASLGRWALSLGLVFLGGISWYLFGWGLVAGPDIIAMLAAVPPALTCLAAGWLLRSRRGLVAALVVYIATAALLWVLAVGGGPAGMAFLSATFALYVVLPAIVFATIGTAIGMYRASQA